MLIAVLIAFAMGACAGSFLGVIIHRLPRGLSIVTPPSRCGACGTLLSWYENIPILGWLALRGRCRHCGTAIPASCLFLELGTAAISALVAWGVLGHEMFWCQPLLDAFPDRQWLAQGAALATLLALTWLILAATVIDFELLLIPDEISSGLQVLALPLAVLSGTNLIWSTERSWPPLIWLFQRWDRFDGWVAIPQTAAWRIGLIAVLGCGLIIASLPLARRIYTRFGGAAWTDTDHRAMSIGAWWFSGWTLLWTGVAVAVLLLWPPGILETPLASNALLRMHSSVVNALLGSLVGWWLPWGIALGGTVIFRRSAMGYGDVKLFCVLGAFLGPVGTLAAFAAAVVVGAVVGLPARLLGAGREMPFGPALAIGTAIVIAAGPWLAPPVLIRLARLLGQA